MINIWFLVIGGILGVFAGLCILCIFLIIVQKISINISKSKHDKSSSKTSIQSSHKDISGELAAAMAVTLYLNQRSFDEHKKLLTIQNNTKPYSPWINSRKVQIVADCNKVFNRER